MDPKILFAGMKLRFPGKRFTDVSQVAGIERLLAAWTAYGTGDRRHLAYLLATSKWETGNLMQPVRETFATSDAQAIARLDKAWKKGTLTWVKTPYWRDGFFGRGDVQLTHAANYVKMGKLVGVDLGNHPELALDPAISARILIEGCTREVSVQGDFTGHALEEFINDQKCDWLNARRVVNPGDHDSFKPIAEEAEAFDAALDAAGMKLFTVRDMARATDAGTKAVAAALGAPAPPTRDEADLAAEVPQRAAESQQPRLPPILTATVRTAMRSVPVLNILSSLVGAALSATADEHPDIRKAVAKVLAKAAVAPEVTAAAETASRAVEAMPGAKPWYQSLGVLGSFAGIIAAAGGLVGLNLTAGDVNEVIAQGTVIAGAATALVTLWGRIRAKHPIGTPTA